MEEDDIRKYYRTLGHKNPTEIILSSNELYPDCKQISVDNEDDFVNYYRRLTLDGIKFEIKESLPKILLPNKGDTLTIEFIEEVSKLIRNKNVFYRVSDDSIVEIYDNKLKKVNPSRMISLIEEVCVPGTEVSNVTRHFIKKSANEQTCKTLLESKIIRDSLRRIEKILNVPIPFLKNGILGFPKRGYNEELKLYLNPSAPEIEKSNLSLEESKKILLDIFDEFCFEKDIEIVKSVLSLLTPFCRGLYKKWNSRTPIFAYMANRERAGKDTLANIRTIVFQGSPIEEPPICTGQSNNSDNQELRKKLLSAIMEGKQIIHFANNKGHIDNSILEQISTAEVWSDRILGKNKTATFDNVLEISLSGNIGTTFTPDLANRSIIINLFLKIENPNDRKFKRNLNAYIEENRSLILSALYSLVRNWYENGMPRSVIPFTSFPEWAGICGGILESAGVQNPLIYKNEGNITMDTETQEIKKLFEFVYEEHPDEWIRKNNIKKIIRPQPENEEGNLIYNFDESLPFYYLDFEERGNQIKFGQILEKYAGREFSGITMIFDKTTKKKSHQQIKFTKVRLDNSLDLGAMLNM